MADKIPSKLPIKENEPDKLQEPIPFGQPSYINPDSRLDRDYDEPVYDKIKILPPEIKKQIKKLGALEESDMFAVYEYLERLIQDGEEFDEAVKRTFENIWPQEEVENGS